MIIPDTEIVITAKGEELCRQTLPPGGYVIGTEENCEVQIDVDLVSGRHAQLVINQDHVLVEDLGSGSGTFINGKKVTESVRLFPGQRIQVGEATIELRRQKAPTDSDVSLLPRTAVVRRMLPEEILHERRYDIGGIVAQGGMGAILNAQETAIERTVAMKVMLETSSGEDLVRFISEAKVTGQLEHPNIVPVHELGVDENDQVFYTMKFVRGITLKKVLELMGAGMTETMAKYPLGLLLTVFQKVCDAVAFAHSKRVIHRDLKPENIMLGDYGEVLVMDWGLAKVMTDASESAEPVRTIRPSVRMVAAPSAGGSTLGGTVMGTPQYMAPEQARGEVESLDERADIYGLGAILYHILALRPSIEGEDAWAIVERVAAGATDPLPEVQSAHLPAGRLPNSLAAVVRKAMAFDRTQRYASVADLQEDITAYQNGFATSAERAGAIRQLHLLMMRHKPLAFSIAAGVLLSAAFMVKVIHSERAATAAKIVAERSEAAAKAAEAVALEQSNTARRALARSQVSLSEAAYREFDGRGMLAALESVPEELREADWRYLHDRADNSQATVAADPGKLLFCAAANPKQPGVFAIAGDSSKIMLVDALSGQRVLEFPLTKSQSGTHSSSIEFSPDGERLIVNRLGKKTIAIYEARTGKPLVEWEVGEVERVGFSLDGTKVFARKSTGDLTVNEASSGRLLWTAKAVARAAFTSNGQVIATNGRSVRILDGATGTLLRKLPDLPDAVAEVRTSGDGAMMVVGCSDGVVRGVRLADGAVTFEQRLVENRRNPWVAMSGDGRRIVAAADQPGGRRAVRVWDAATGVTLQTLMGGNGRIDGLALHPLTDEVILIGPDTRVWPIATRPVESTIGGATPTASVFWEKDDLFIGSTRPLKLSGDGRWNSQPFTLPPECGNAGSATSAGEIAAFGRSLPTGSVIAIMKKSGNGFSLLRTVRTKTWLGRIRLSPDGQRLAAADGSYTLEVFDVATGQRLCECERGKTRYLQEIAWLGHDRLVGIVSSSERGKARTEECINLWDATTGRIVREVTNPTPMDQLAIAPDGKTFAEAGDDRRVRIRDAETLAIVREFRVHDGAITALAFHPTKPVLATAATDFTVRLWNLADASLIEELRVSGAETARLAFSPSGLRLASTDRNNLTAMLNLEQPPLGKFTRRTNPTQSETSGAASSAASTLRSAGNAHARAGRFPQAVAAYTEALALEPTASLDWFRIAVLLAQVGDETTYGSNAHKALATFATTIDPETMERIVKIALLLPIDESDLAIACKLAHTPITIAPDHPGRAYFQFVDAFGHYRSGDFTKAAAVLAETSGTNTMQVQVAALLAMAQYRLGKPDEALATLVRAEGIDGGRLPPPGTDLGDGWQDVLLPRLLLKEARALIAPGTQAPPPPPRALGGAHARFGRWTEARTAFAAAVQADGASTDDWFQFAVALTVLGERSEQRRACREMLARLNANSDLHARDITAKCALLYPVDDLSTIDRDTVLQMADKSAVEGSKISVAPMVEFARALAHYRTGDYAGAAEPLAGWETKSEPRAIVPGGAILAMTQLRLGKTAEARATLVRAEAVAAEKLPLVGTDLSASWPDVAVARILMAEARAVVAPGTQAQLRTAASASAAGDAHARAGRWPDARAAFTEAIQLKPDDHVLWLKLAAVLTQTGERAAHGRLANAVLARFSTATNGSVMDMTTKASLLFPLDGMDAADRRAALRVADRVGSEPNDFFEMCQALAHYRTGDFAGVVSPLAKWAGKSAPVVVASDGALLAMAQYRLYRPSDARATLGQVEAYAAAKLPKAGTDPGGSWYDVIVARLLLTEARTLIGK